MRILLIGKYPPIQGGVSAQTFIYARELAQSGHDVFVVTNAREVESGYRMFMRPKDWALSEPDAAPGRLRVYWTEADYEAQRHIPFHKAFFTKLFSLGLQVAEEHKIDVIFSFYLEPYGLVGHALSRELSVPHIVKTAGSDIGRLRLHPQFGQAFNRVFRHAAAIWTAASLREDLIASCGVDADRIYSRGRLVIPEDIFNPAGDALDLRELEDDLRRAGSKLEEPGLASSCAGRNFIGMYGKISANKGVFDLLHAFAGIARVRDDFGLLLMGGGTEDTLASLRAEIRALDIVGQVVHIPFLPYWRVPEFIRRCAVVCCLERDFSIEIHNPVIAREVMTSGGVLVGSTEILRKMPSPERLVSDYNCFAVRKVQDHVALAETLVRASASRDGAGPGIVGARARRYATEVQAGQSNLASLEMLLARATDRSRRAPSATSVTKRVPGWQKAAQAALSRRQDVARSDMPDVLADEPHWRQVLATWWDSDRGGSGACATPYLEDVLKVCAAVSRLPPPAYWPSDAEFAASVFRLRTPLRSLDAPSIFQTADLFEIGDVQVLKLRHDAASVLAAVSSGDLPDRFEERDSGIAVQRGIEGFGPKVFALDSLSADILASLRDRRSDPIAAPRAAVAASLMRLFEMGLVGIGP